MDPNLTNLLTQLGIGIASNAIYDFFKNRVPNGAEYNQVKTDLVRFLNVDGADVKAENIIDFLVKKGDISITNSHIYAKGAIKYSSSPNSIFSIQSSKSKTDRTAIHVGGQAKIVGQGGAGIRQNSDGSITFET